MCAGINNIFIKCDFTFKECKVAEILMKIIWEFKY